MYLLFSFFRKFQYFLFFILLQIISLNLIINKNEFHKLVLNKQIILFNGWYNAKIYEIKSYFSLREENTILQNENNQLRSLLYGTKKIDSIRIKIINDSLRPFQTYEYISANTSNNRLVLKDNFFYINRGTNHGISNDMGVITAIGIAGQVFETSKNYSKVMSVLNSKIRVNARVKNNEYFGTLIWDGDDPRLMHLQEVPKYAEVEIGDTIETSNSTIFPEGLLIGRVAGLNVEKKTGNWDISVELFQEMAKLSKVNVIRKITVKQPIQPQDSLQNAQ